MKRIKKLLIGATIILTSIITLGATNKVNAESGGPLYLGLVSLRSSGYGYVQGEKKVWKIVKYESTAGGTADESQTIYCIKAGPGFGSSDMSTGGVQTISTYTQKFNLKDLSSITSPYKSVLPTGENYNKLMWVLDHLYTIPATDNETERLAFLKNVIPEERYSLLTKDDIDVVQQLAIWHFTNSGSDYDYTDIELYINSIQNDEASTYKTFEDLYGEDDGWDRADAVQALYDYYINGAQANYTTVNATTKPVEIVSTNAAMQTIGSNYVAGPYKINQLLNVDYTLTATYTDLNNNTITPTLGVKNSSGNIVETSKTLKELVGTEFYLIVPKTSNITGIKMTISSSYTTRTATYWSVANAPQTEQPVVIVASKPYTFAESTQLEVPTQLTVSKVWDDNNNQDGIQPSSVEVVLLKDGKETSTTATLSSSNNWTYTFSNLAAKENGAAITYSVKEKTTPTNYTVGITKNTTTDGSFSYTVTNTHTPATTQLKVNKVWSDNNNQDGIRPSSVEVVLLKDGKETSTTATLSSSNNWTYTFSNLAAKENGAAITYSVKEKTTPTNYTVGITKNTTTDGSFSYTVTNTHTPATTQLKVNKVWSDNNNQDGIRPSSVEVVLLKDGKETSTTATLSSSNNWTYTFSNLAAKENGAAITYSVKEKTTPTNYTVDITKNTTTDGSFSYTVTNTHTPATTQLKVNKVWSDNNNQDGIRPSSVEVVLLKDGKETSTTATLSSSNNWTYTFSNLAAKENGTAITYSVKEKTTPTNYTVDIKKNTTTDGSFSYTVTNTHTPGVTQLVVNKVWDDNNNQDGIRATEVVVALVKNGTETSKTVTLNASNKWTATFTDLPIKENGTAVEYSVAEKTTIEGYSDALITKNTTTDGSFSYTVTNTHTPETTQVEVNKVWDDSNNQDGIRATEVVVALVKDGTETNQTVTLNEDNKWTATFTNLPAKENGKTIEYTVVEKTVIDGYTTKITNNVTGDTTTTSSTTANSTKKLSYTVTNTHTSNKLFDLSLRKYITSVDGVELTGESSRVPDISTDSLKTTTTATYNHKKDPVKVKTGSSVIYKITIYNEGDKAGRATKVADQLPTGLEFVKVVSGNFELDSYNKTDNKLNLKRKSDNSTNLPAYDGKTLSSETIEIECKVIQTAGNKDKVLTNVAWISEEIDGETNEVITNQEGKDRDSEPSTTPNVNKDNMEDYTGNNNKADLTDSDYYYKGQQDDDDFEKLILEKATGSYNVQVLKVDKSDSNKKLSGVEFKVTLADGTTQTTKTDANGYIKINNIDITEEGTDTITIEELTTLENYEKIIGTLKLEITKKLSNGKYIVSSSKLKNKDGSTVSDGVKVANNNTTVTVTVPNRKKEFDLSLRKFITSVNGEETTARVPQVDTTALKNGTSTTATYNHTKTPVSVDIGDTVVYTIRVYNEGEIDGYVEEITDHLPDQLEFLPNNETNKTYGWKMYDQEGKETTDSSKAKTIKTAYLSKANESTTGANKIAAFDGTTLSYKDVKIACKVVATDPMVSKITNIADITDFTDGNGNKVTDRDSQENNVKIPEDLPGYKDDEISKDYVPGQQDDDDFEKLILKELDLSLRKFITKVDGTSITTRIPQVDTTALKNGTSTTATYNHSKEPVEVTIGSTVEYTVRVYNEGDVDGYAEEITDHLPDQLEFLPDNETNKTYGWKMYDQEGKETTDVSKAETIKTTYLSKANESSTGANKIAAFDKTNDKLDYKDVKVVCKVVKTENMPKKITNIADITDFTDGNGNKVTDRDSQEDNVKIPEDLPGYKDDETDKDYVPGQQDDDDFEKLVVKEFDLSLRKFITAVNSTEVTSRIPQVDTTELKNGTSTTATYNHSKEPVLVTNGSIVTYTIRIYNEGEVDGYASKIKDDIPEGLEYLPDNETNKTYRWVMLDENGEETTDISKAKALQTDYLSKEQEKESGSNLIKAYDKETDKLDYKDVKIAFEVTEPSTSDRIVINQAQISENKDKNGNEVEDRDSTPDKWNEGEDDQDIEKVKVQYFDLSLRKWVTEAIVIENGKQTVTQTGHKAEDDPEEIVKVDLKKSKINNVTVKFRYKIRVTNEGNIAGYAKELKDYIPDGLEFVAEDNPLWTKADDKTITTDQTKDTLLQPGETTEVEVVLKWVNNSENFGVMDNWAEISKDKNDYNAPDIDSTPNNKKQGEDDIDDAPVMLAVQTGEAVVYVGTAMATLVLLGTGLVLIKKYVL